MNYFFSSKSGFLHINYAETKARNGKKTDLLKGKESMKNYQIERVSKATCKEFLDKYHYLSKMGCGFRSGFNYGLYDEGELIGVAVFHTVSAGETVQGCFGLPRNQQKGIWELGRFATDDKKREKNTPSWFLSRCIKKLRSETVVRAIITYADSDYHVGYLYQATNFKYYGLSSKKKDFWALKPDGSYAKQSRGKTIGVEGEWRDRSRKHRYVKVFDKKLKIRWIEEAYPKN